MRDYGAVSPQFWIGKTGKALRGNPHAQLLALYLMTCPHASMIGVFHCPVVYMAHETGIPLEGASKGLQSLIDAGFCQYDHDTEEVFILRMAAFQIGERLEAKDNRCKSTAREYEKVQSALIKAAFYATYSVAFHLPKPDKSTSPYEAPSKPLRSQDKNKNKNKNKNTRNYLVLEVKGLTRQNRRRVLWITQHPKAGHRLRLSWRCKRWRRQVCQVWQLGTLRFWR